MALLIEPMLISYVGLAKVYVKMDQPLAAIEVCEKGLDKFPLDVSLLTEMARYYGCYVPGVLGLGRFTIGCSDRTNNLSFTIFKGPGRVAKYDN